MKIGLLTLILVNLVSIARRFALLFRPRYRKAPGFARTRELTEKERDMGVRLTEKGVKYLVHPDELRSGFVPKEGIASIDRPRFESAEQADRWLDDSEAVLATEYAGVTRVYPLRILIWHELVNDRIGGTPVVISYCPLCNSGIGYFREVAGWELEFGVSGRVYNSNLVMYDRQTNSYWPQIEGRAVIGELTGHRLRKLPGPVSWVRWGDWKKEKPESEVLSQKTGFIIKPYAIDPYKSYHGISWILFPVAARDERASPKAVVIGVEVNGSEKAYREDDIWAGAIEDTIDDRRVRLEGVDPQGIRVTDIETGDPIPYVRLYWFAWYAFHPFTDFYEPGK